MRHFLGEKGQSSIELIVITMLVLVLVVGIIRITAEINRGNSSIAIIKAHLIKAIDNQDQVYFIRDIIPKTISGGQSKATITVDIEPEPVSGNLPSEICDAAIAGKTAVEQHGIYDEIIFDGTIKTKCP